MPIDTIFIIDDKGMKTRRHYNRRRSIIREFALNTSTHGIPGIARSQSIHNTIFWSICCCAFTGITFYFVTQEILRYFEYSTHTSIDMIYEWPQYFPAFTVCNIAPVRYDRFIGPFMNYMTTLNFTYTNDTSSLRTEYIGGFFQSKINQNESLDEFFFPLGAMLIKCVFNERPCSAVNFTPFISSSYGFCYTFNARSKNIRNVLYSNEYGGPGNLQLSFFIHNHQYVPHIREGQFIYS